MRTVMLVCLLMACASVMANLELKVAMRSIDLIESTTLGEIDIDGAGRVQLTEHRTNRQVVIKASGP